MLWGKSLLSVLNILNKDSKSKVIIIEGSGNGFSAGHNLKEIQSLKQEKNLISIHNELAVVSQITSIV